MTDHGAVPASATRAMLLEHAQTVEEQAARHAVTLESLLAILRSPRLDDRAARATAVDLAVEALIGLRSGVDEQQAGLLEPVTAAFARLREDLRPLVRFGDLEMQFVDPPRSGRALPGEVAHTARSIVRIAVLALIHAGDARRVRIHWDCDGLHLLMSIRDDGRGELTANHDSLRPIVERVIALDGALDVDSTAGWGSTVGIRIPLDPPAPRDTPSGTADLTAREREVLGLVASGQRNKAIAEALGISPNTVKYHVSKLLQKTGSTSRAELVAIGVASL